jgi:hypothetical protein
MVGTSLLLCIVLRRTKMRRTLPLLVVCVLVNVASAQLIVGVDEPSVQAYGYDLSTETWTPLFDGYEIWGLAADDAGRMLYFNDGVDLFKVPYDTLVPEFVATITYDGSSSSMVGLGYFGGKLYGTKNISTEAVYEIDPGTGVAELKWAYPTAFDFGGIDMDEGGTLYGLSDAGGAGLYEIDFENQLTQFIVGYPDPNETDLDGLAVGGGRAYFVTDDYDPGLIYVYNFGLADFEDPIPAPWTTSEIFAGGAWAPGLIPEPMSLALLALGALAMFRRR